MYARFDTVVTDTQSDGLTDTARRHRPRLCIASRGNCISLSTMLACGDAKNFNEIGCKFVALDWCM